MYTDIRNSIIQIVKSCLTEYPNTIVRNSHQDEKLPAGTSLTVNVLEFFQVGMAQKSGRLDQAGKITTIVPMEVQIGLSFTGSTAQQVAFSFYSRLKNGANYTDESIKQNIKVLRKTSLRRIPYRDGEKWVEYSNFNAVFHLMVGYSETVLPVNQVIVEDTNNQITFTIPNS